MPQKGTRLSQGQELDQGKVLAVCDYPHPDDSHLQQVLVEQPNAAGTVHTQYVVWTYNVQTGGFCSGHYCMRGETAARRVWATRVAAIVADWQVDENAIA